MDTDRLPAAWWRSVASPQAGYRKMVQNLGWAAGSNVPAIPLAAGALAWAGSPLASIGNVIADE